MQNQTELSRPAASIVDGDKPEPWSFPIEHIPVMLRNAAIIIEEKGYDAIQDFRRQWESLKLVLLKFDFKSYPHPGDLEVTDLSELCYATKVAVNHFCTWFMDHRTGLSLQNAH